MQQPAGPRDLALPTPGVRARHTPSPPEAQETLGDLTAAQHRQPAGLTQISSYLWKLRQVISPHVLPHLWDEAVGVPVLSELSSLLRLH